MFTEILSRKWFIEENHNRASRNRKKNLLAYVEDSNKKFELKDIEIVGEADSIKSAKTLLKKSTPDLIFLDIQLSDGLSFEIFDVIEVKSAIIFTTAYDEYALKAFKLNSVDYLLKPLRPSKVKEAVAKAISQLGKSQINIKLEELKNALTQSNFKKIALPVSDGIRFVPFEDIVMMEADGMYTKISMTQEEILISKPLKHFVDLLAQIPVFYKPHRSYLVNLTYIKQYVKSDGGYILMDNDHSVSISKEKREEFLSIMQAL